MSYKGLIAQKDIIPTYRVSEGMILQAVRDGRLQREKKPDHRFYYQVAALEKFLNTYQRSTKHWHDPFARPHTTEEGRTQAEVALAERDRRGIAERNFITNLVEAGVKVVVKSRGRWAVNGLRVLPQAHWYYAEGKSYIGFPVR